MKSLENRNFGAGASAALMLSGFVPYFILFYFFFYFFLFYSCLCSLHSYTV